MTVARQRGHRQNTQSIGVPSPIKGIIATGIFGRNSASEGDLGVDSAIWLYNMIPGEYGVRIRPGSRETVTSIPDSDGADGDVRSIMFFNSIIAGGSADHVFAATDMGIHDVTAGGAGPWVLGDLVSDLVWPNQGGNAGWLTALNYTNVGGDHFLLITDEDNGYYIFNGTTWAAGTFTGSPKPDADKLVQIVEWNGRIWFVEKNSARAWFLDPLALSGDITPMDVGSRFKEGGHLVQNSTWSLDAGDGLDDKFVMCSSAGDILVWEGIDPTTAADLILIGRWAVGSVPEGRKVMSDWGGDVIILSTGGMVTCSALLQGNVDLDGNQYISRNISQYMRAEMASSLNEYGWSLLQVPHQNITIVSVPTPPLVSRQPIQFVMETSTNAWCMFRDLDIRCQVQSGHTYLFGTSDGRIMSLEGTTDEILLDGTSSKAITFSMLTHYSGMGMAANWKRPQWIRPYWIGSAQPVFNVQIRYDFDLTELLVSPPFVELDVATWDNAIWDNDLWAGTAQSYLETIGVNGMGRHVAVAYRGEATNELTYVGADIMFDVGGLL